MTTVPVSRLVPVQVALEVTLPLMKLVAADNGAARSAKPSKITNIRRAWIMAERWQDKGRMSNAKQMPNAKCQMPNCGSSIGPGSRSVLECGSPLYLYGRGGGLGKR